MHITGEAMSPWSSWPWTEQMKLCHLGAADHEHNRTDGAKSPWSSWPWTEQAELCHPGAADHEQDRWSCVSLKKLIMTMNRTGGAMSPWSSWPWTEQDRWSCVSLKQLIMTMTRTGVAESCTWWQLPFSTFSFCLTFVTMIINLWTIERHKSHPLPTIKNKNKHLFHPTPNPHPTLNPTRNKQALVYLSVLASQSPPPQKKKQIYMSACSSKVTFHFICTFLSSPFQFFSIIVDFL